MAHFSIESELWEAQPSQFCQLEKHNMFWTVTGKSNVSKGWDYPYNPFVASEFIKKIINKMFRLKLLYLNRPTS